MRSSSASRAFFAGLIDYAGLFPPAALALPAAIRQYRTYLDTPDRWILSRFIAAASHLEKITPELEALFSSAAPLDLSLVAKNPASDIPAAAARAAASGGRLSLSAVEIPLDPHTAPETQLDAALRILDGIDPGQRGIAAYFEVPFSADWDSAAVDLLDALAARRTGLSRAAGFKIRTGGLEAHLVPSPERLAAAIVGAAERRIPVKFTAGLHQPFRHHPAPGEEGSAGVPMHGYFNVFFGAIVAARGGVNSTAIAEIIGDMSGERPAAAPGEIRWLGRTVSMAEIAAARRDAVISFGSCSFVEPVDFARQLGWL